MSLFWLVIGSVLSLSEYEFLSEFKSEPHKSKDFARTVYSIIKILTCLHNSLFPYSINFLEVLIYNITYIIHNM